MGLNIAFLVIVGILFSGIVGITLIAIFAKKYSQRLSVMAIASGVLFALVSLYLIHDCVYLSLRSHHLALYTVLNPLTALAFATVAVFVFARVREAFLAIPFGFFVLQSCIYFIEGLPPIEFWHFYGFRGLEIFLPNAVSYFLVIAFWVIMFVAVVTYKNRKALCITAGIIYAVRTIFAWLIFPIIDAIKYDYLDFSYFIAIVRNVSVILEIAVGIAVILLGFALSKLAPAMPKRAPYGYAPNGYVPNGYAQRPPVQNTYGYAPVQTQMQNAAPAQTSAPRMQYTPSVQVNSNVVPQTPFENAVQSVESTDTEKIAEQLSAYKKMLDNGLITEADFEAKKKQLLGL